MAPSASSSIDNRRNSSTSNQVKNRIIVANGNIYETIRDDSSSAQTLSARKTKLLISSPITESKMVSKQISRSAGQLDDGSNEVTRPLLCCQYQSHSENQLPNLSSVVENETEAEADEASEMAPLFGRRTENSCWNDNEDERKFAIDRAGDICLSKPAKAISNNFSETLELNGKHEYDYPAAGSEAIYARPRASPVAGPSFVDMEMNQLIELKRKRTMTLLRSKEAPKASFELTSPTGNSDTILDDLSISEEDFSGDARSAGCVSYYENADSSSVMERLNQIALSLQSSRPKSPVDLKQHYSEGSSDQDKLEGGITSGTDEANTLSIVSDILGDLSQEGNSLIQQLSRDQSVNQFYAKSE